MGRKLRIALVGGGIGGLTAALALSRQGFETHLFEQAGELKEIGAGIGISPSAVKVLRALGLAQETMARAFESEAIVGRDWMTGQPTFHFPLQGARARFGAPHIQVHRADLVDILAGAARHECHVYLGTPCVAVSSSADSALLKLD
jgi:salicylate hydroxylase